jgi:phosphatidylinositol alpha-mannosyltransferase
LASELRCRDYTVKIIAPCSKKDSIDDLDFIPFDRPVIIPSGGSWARVSVSLWNRRRIQTMLDNEHFDVLHFHEPFAGSLTVNLIALSDSVNVGTFHTYGGHKAYRMGLSRLGNPYFKKLHGKIAVSEPARQFISQHYPGDYEIIPNGVNTELYSSAQALDKYKDGYINLLWVGRLDKRKGLKYLLEAYGSLKWNYPKLRLIVVGPGEPDGDCYRTISERNLQDITFVGSVSDKTKASFYKTADIYCSPATGNESFGIVLIEAMAAGTPIVATNIEGYSSVITNGENGLLVSPKNSNEIAKSISRIIEDKKLTKKLISAGKKDVEQYRWATVTDQILKVYKKQLKLNVTKGGKVKTAARPIVWSI